MDIIVREELRIPAVVVKNGQLVPISKEERDELPLEVEIKEEVLGRKSSIKKVGTLATVAAAAITPIQTYRYFGNAFGVSTLVVTLLLGFCGVTFKRKVLK